MHIASLLMLHVFCVRTIMYFVVMSICITQWNAGPCTAHLSVFNAAPAAAPQSVSKPMETVPPARSLVRSGAEDSRSHGIPIAALILTAAAAGGAVVT